MRKEGEDEEREEERRKMEVREREEGRDSKVEGNTYTEKGRHNECTLYGGWEGEE